MKVLSEGVILRCHRKGILSNGWFYQILMIEDEYHHPAGMVLAIASGIDESGYRSEPIPP